MGSVMCRAFSDDRNLRYTFARKCQLRSLLGTGLWVLLHARRSGVNSETQPTLAWLEYNGCALWPTVPGTERDVTVGLGTCSCVVELCLGGRESLG